MIENLKIHAELSLMSDDGLGSEYRISLKSDSLQDAIPEAVAERIKNMPETVVTANMDGQGNYYFYGKKQGDMITLRVPKMENYGDELLKFQSGEENYIEKEFEIAAIVSRPLAQEEGFLNVDPWSNAQSVIMTNEQMEEYFGINNYSFINASPADGSETKSVSNQLLQVIRDVPKAVLQDYTSAIETQKNYLNQQQVFFSSIAVILLIISLFHILNSMNHTILTKRREYGIIRAMGITDNGFYKMIMQIGILYGLLADVFIFLLYNLVLRRVMDYYMAHVLQLLHLTSAVPNMVLIGIMLLNIIIAVIAVMFPAQKMIRANIIDEVRG